jgi:hypothetical protein
VAQTPDRCRVAGEYALQSHRAREHRAEAGQAAVVKVESFPFTRYGTIDGTVIKVSRDAVEEREASALSDPRLKRLAMVQPSA